MKKILLLLVLVLYGVVYSQNDGNPSADTDANLIPFPTSPEAAKLGVFGNIPVTLSAGQMNYQVPLYTLQVNEYSWPITLSYSFGGLILEDKPSLSGMSWNLTAGGTVVREVRGLPDEHPRGYYGSKDFRLTHLKPFFDRGEITKSTIDQILDGRMDAEPDKYTLSVNGINFSFKIDKDKNPVYLSKHNYKVSITWQAGQNHRIDAITLIDDKGYTYIFNVKERNEPLEGNEIVFNDGFTGYTSSWMLSKVILPNAREIGFTYVDHFYQSLDFFASGFRSYNVPAMSCSGGNSGNVPDHGYSDGYAKTLISRKVLAGITSPSGNVLFPVNTNDDRVKYHAMIINNTNAETINTYAFQYEGYRDLLTSITKNNTPFYSFEYHNKGEIPGFHTTVADKPTAQDTWGFYNGQSNTHALSIPFTQYSANKTPSTAKTMIGALTKITYPTGGYSMIDYEANTIKQEYLASNATGALPANREINLLFKSDNDLNANTYKERSVRYTFKTDVYATISHRITSENQGRILASIQREGSCPAQHQFTAGGDYPTVAGYYRRVEDVEIPTFCPALGIELSDGDPDITTLSGTSGGYIIIPQGTYIFKIYTDNNKNKDVSGHIQVKFHELPDTPQEQILYTDVTVGGIRVKSIQEFDGVTNEPIKQRFFDYSADDGYSSGTILQQGITKYAHKVEVSCGNGNQFFNYLYDRVNYSYKTYNPVNLNQGVPVYYKQVKEYEDRYTKNIPSYTVNSSPFVPVNYDGSRTFRILSDPYATRIHYYPKGYTETTYENPRQYYTYGYPVLPNGVDKSMGRVSSQTVYRFETTDSTVHKINQTVNEYKQIRGLIDQDGNDYNPLHPKGLKIGYKIKKEGNIITTINVNDYFTFATYKEYDNNFVPQHIKTTQYYPQAITTEEFMTFDAYDQVIRTEVVDSRGKKQVSQMQYPYDVNEPTYNAMVNKNVIATPVMTTALIDQQTLSKTKTEFYDLGGRLFKPKTKLSAKGDTALEPRLHIDQYDTYGNIIEYHAVSNPTHRYTSVIWGYNGQYPIAKIENASFAEVAAALGITAEVLKGYNETSLATLHTLRGLLPKAMVTTYTYAPLVGITSMTDPKGYSTSYEYDHLNRVEHIKDSDNNLVDKFYYYYKDPSIATDPGSATDSYPELQVSFDIFPDFASSFKEENFKTLISGGSGQYDYQWEFEAPNGAITTIKDKMAYYFHFQNHQAGTNTIRFKVRDKVTGKQKTISRSLVVYRVDIQFPRTVTVNNTATFTASISGGSGNYSYKWLIYGRDSNYTPTARSFNLKMGYNYYGADKYIHCDITDNSNGHTIKVYKKITVNGARLGQVWTKTFSQVNSGYHNERFAVSGTQGSGRYKYRWTSSDGRSSSGTEFSVYMDRCRESQDIRCRVTDLMTGLTHTYKKEFYFFPSRCNGLGGGGGGPTDPIPEAGGVETLDPNYNKQ